MTKTTITSYTTFLCMVVLLAGAATALASEVTGTLSSDTSSNTQTTGSISGTVSSGNGGSSSSGNRSSGRGSGSSSNAPAGSVLGATTSNPPTPGFPNAGFAPEEDTATDTTVWSVVKTFFKNMLSF